MSARDRREGFERQVRRGRLAHLLGRPIDRCPWPELSPARGAWILGWQQRDAEAKAEALDTQHAP